MPGGRQIERHWKRLTFHTYIFTKVSQLWRVLQPGMDLLGTSQTKKVTGRWSRKLRSLPVGMRQTSAVTRMDTWDEKEIESGWSCWARIFCFRVKGYESPHAAPSAYTQVLPSQQPMADLLHVSSYRKCFCGNAQQHIILLSICTAVSCSFMCMQAVCKVLRPKVLPEMHCGDSSPYFCDVVRSPHSTLLIGCLPERICLETARQAKCVEQDDQSEHIGLNKGEAVTEHFKQSNRESE